jgi:hypothetical protein
MRCIDPTKPRPVVPNCQSLPSSGCLACQAVVTPWAILLDAFASRMSAASAGRESVQEALIEIYLAGISVRRVEDITG